MTPRIIFLIAGLAFVAALLIFGPAACQKFRSQAAQNRMNTEQGGAFADSAGNAINTVEQAGARDAESETLTATNEREIRAAPGADQQASTEVNRAGRNAVCKRLAYRDTPQCKKDQTP